MKLTHMKESRRKSAEVPKPSKGPSYPWGLQLNLDDAALSKLGIKGLPAVGSEMRLHARVRVTDAAHRDSTDGGKSRSAGFQITHLGVGADPSGKSVKTVKRVATPPAAVKAPVKLTRVKGK